MRNATQAPGIEFGHNNPAGYGSTLGSELVSGKSFLAFHAEGGTTNGTYRTRGFAGSILRGTQTGGLDIGTAAATNADNQTLTVTLTIDPEGRLVFTGVTFANLGTPANGAVVYCSNCTVAATCASGGTGALAKRLNNAWVCN